MPTRAPASDGSASSGPAPGRLSAAAAPTRPNSATPATPSRTLRRATIPTAMAKTASSTTIPPIRTTLSRSPNCRMANSFSARGVRSMTAPPTATTGADCGRTAAATSSPTPTATAAASAPAAPLASLVPIRAPFTHRVRRSTARGSGPGPPRGLPTSTYEPGNPWWAGHYLSCATQNSLPSGSCMTVHS